MCGRGARVSTYSEFTKNWLFKRIHNNLYIQTPVYRSPNTFNYNISYGLEEKVVRADQGHKFRGFPTWHHRVRNDLGAVTPTFPVINF